MTEHKYSTCSSPKDVSTGGVFLSEQQKAVKVTHLLSEPEMDAVIGAMARKIIDECEDMPVLVGIKTRGVPLANKLRDAAKKHCGTDLNVGSIDINLYRDDLSEVDIDPVIGQSELPFSVAGRGVILVDDVLYTGRTVRAALDAVIDFGRPKYIRLAVLIDRGFRELPIEANYVGRAVKTTAVQNVKVMFAETDGQNQVIIKG